MNNRKLKIAVSVFTVLALAVTAVLAASAEYGSKEDPLVTASYITEVVKPQIEKDIDSIMAEKKSELLKELGSSGVGGGLSGAVIDEIAKRAAELVGSGVAQWQVIKVPNGKTLTGEVGTQLLLRLGGAQCASPDATGLINLSDASVIGSGAALKANNLYMVTIDGRGFKAVGDATVLIKGAYTIK